MRTLYVHNVNFAILVWDLRRKDAAQIGEIFGSRLWDGSLHDDGSLLSIRVGSKGGGWGKDSDYICIMETDSGLVHCPTPKEPMKKEGSWGLSGELVAIGNRTAIFEYQRYESDKPVGPLSRIQYGLDDRKQVETLETDLRQKARDDGRRLEMKGRTLIRGFGLTAVNALLYAIPSPAAEPPEEPLSLWHDEPATEWTEALP